MYIKIEIFINNVLFLFCMSKGVERRNVYFKYVPLHEKIYKLLEKDKLGDRSISWSDIVLGLIGQKKEIVELKKQVKELSEKLDEQKNQHTRKDKKLECYRKKYGEINKEDDGNE
jgi:predicted CopG family antitoxin